MRLVSLFVDDVSPRLFLRNQNEASVCLAMYHRYQIVPSDSAKETVHLFDPTGLLNKSGHFVGSFSVCDLRSKPLSNQFQEARLSREENVSDEENYEPDFRCVF